MTSFIASWCHWDEVGSVPNRLGAESHTEEFRAACEEVWQQNRLVVERGVDRGVAVVAKNDVIGVSG
jgi:hypothetical protein